VLEVRAAEFLEHVPAARTGHDIEHLHDLRVAGRRLRAVLEVFDAAFPPRLHRELLREVKRAADSLGAARDLDVQIALVERFHDAASDEERPGVAALLQRLRGEREAAYDAFGPALDRLEGGTFGGQVLELTAP
jgi:CHAD domain-containing protein